MLEHNDAVLENVLKYLDPETYFNARQVSTVWRSVASASDNLYHHISHQLLDNTEEELKSKLFHIKQLTTIDNDSSSAVLIDTYLDLVRFKMIFFDIEGVNSLKLNTNLAASSVRCMSNDGTKLLIAQNKGSGSIELTLVHVSTAKCQVFKHTNRRSPELVALSPDNQYVALTSSYGFLEVLQLQEGSMSCNILYSRQYPSHFESLQVTRGGEVFMGKSIRLGGYSLVNLSTKEEIDIGHYRLDLSLVSLFDDLVLMLPGREDTFIYGWPLVENNRLSQVDREPGQIWSYYKYLVQNNIFCYMSLKNAIPLPLNKNLLLALDTEEEDEEDLIESENNSNTANNSKETYRLNIVRQPIEQPIGFKSFSEFAASRKRKREEHDEDENQSDQDDHTLLKSQLELDDSNSNSNENSDLTSESSDSDLYQMLNLNEVATPDSYVLSLDSTRLALRKDDHTIIIYSLGGDLLNHFDWGLLPGRVFLLPELLSNYPVAETRMKFIDNDKLVLVSNNFVQVLAITSKSKQT